MAFYFSTKEHLLSCKSGSFASQKCLFGKVKVPLLLLKSGSFIFLRIPIRNDNLHNTLTFKLLCLMRNFWDFSAKTTLLFLRRKSEDVNRKTWKRGMFRKRTIFEFYNIHYYYLNNIGCINYYGLMNIWIIVILNYSWMVTKSYLHHANRIFFFLRLSFLLLLVWRPYLKALI